MRDKKSTSFSPNRYTLALMIRQAGEINGMRGFIFMSYQIERANRFIESKMKELEESKLLPLNLQFFADGDSDNEDEGDSEGDNDDSGDEGDSEGDNQDPSLEELLKNNPDLKKQYNALFKKQFNKRLKGVDLKKAKQLLKNQSGDDADNGDDSEDKEESKVTEKALKLDRKLKRTAVKEYAVDNGLNPKLIARLVDIDSLELDDDGELDIDELEDAIEELSDEFPEIFRKADQADDDEDPEDVQTKKKSRSHTLGGNAHKKTNQKNKKDNLRNLGAQKAQERAERRKNKAFK